MRRQAKSAPLWTSGHSKMGDRQTGEPPQASKKIGHLLYNCAVPSAPDTPCTLQTQACLKMLGRLGCCEQEFYSWVLWEPGSGRINSIKPLCCTPWDLYSFVWHKLWASILHKQGGCRINKLGDRVEYQGQLYPAIKQHTQPIKHTLCIQC